MTGTVLSPYKGHRTALPSMPANAKFFRMHEWSRASFFVGRSIVVWNSILELNLRVFDWVWWSLYMLSFAFIWRTGFLLLLFFFILTSMCFYCVYAGIPVIWLMWYNAFLIFIKSTFRYGYSGFSGSIKFLLIVNLPNCMSIYNTYTNSYTIRFHIRVLQLIRIIDHLVGTCMPYLLLIHFLVLQLWRF